MLGLQHEKFSKKASYERFKEKLEGYILRTYRETGKYVVLAITKGNNPKEKHAEAEKQRPFDKDDEPNEIDEMIKLQEVKNFVSDQSKVQNDYRTLFSIVVGNCSESLMANIKGLTDYDKKYSDCDVVWLMEEFRKASSGVDTKDNIHSQFHDALIMLLTMKQYKDESNDKYLSRFKGKVQALKIAGGEGILSNPFLTGARSAREIHSFYSDKAKMVEEEEKMKAVMFIKRSCEHRYKGLLTLLRDNATINQDLFPKTLAGAYEMMIRHTQAVTVSSGPRNYNKVKWNNKQHMFVQSGKSRDDYIPGKDGIVHANITCFHCKEPGHYSSQCPKSKPVNLTQYGVIMSTFDTSDPISDSWLLLDTCSTVNAVKNKKIIVNIRQVSKGQELQLHSDGGMQVYDKEADLKLFPLTVFYSPTGIANVLSLKAVASIPGAVIKMDTSKERAIFVHLADGRVFKFKECKEGLYYLDLQNVSEFLCSDFSSYRNNSNVAINNYSFLQAHAGTTPSTNPSTSPLRTRSVTPPETAAPGTDKITRDVSVSNNVQRMIWAHENPNTISTTKANKSLFTNKDVARAIGARKLQQKIGWPSTTTFINYLKQNAIINCPYTPEDVYRGLYIFGTPTPLLDGIMTRSDLPPTYKYERVSVPRMILRNYPTVQIAVDFFFVNGIPFFHSISTKLQYRTVNSCVSRSKSVIIQSIKQVIALYRKRGFEVTDILGDGEFNNQDIRDAVHPVLIQITPPEEHQPEVERSIRLIKERSRSATHSVPFRRYPKVMTTNLVKSVVMWLNAFPSTSGISRDVSPASIVEGRSKPNMNIARVPFGSYAICYTKTTNTMKSRAIRGIALMESNETGGHYFMNLTSGKKVNCFKWEELPIDDEVISRVNKLAKDENQPEMEIGYPDFEWEHGHEIQDTFDYSRVTHDNYDNSGDEEKFDIRRDIA